MDFLSEVDMMNEIIDRMENEYKENKKKTCLYK